MHHAVIVPNATGKLFWHMKERLMFAEAIDEKAAERHKILLLIAAVGGIIASHLFSPM